jgi:2-polyprenyl-3-methyl-5-hydroxy-6-metoxy-1,4-benzoquinol methylase
MDHFQASATNRVDAETYTQGLEDSAVELRVKRMRQLIERSLGEFRGNGKTRVLDVGCADGGLLKPFTDRCEVNGIDVHQPFLDAAKKRGFASTTRLDFERDRFPFEDGSMDLLVCGETIEHVVNTDWFMCEVNRVLKVGAPAVFSIPNINQWIGLGMMAIFDLPPRYSARFRAAHVRDFTYRTSKKCLQAFGFEILHAEGTGVFVPGLKKHVLHGLTKLFPRHGAEIVFHLRKTRNVAYDASLAVDHG